MNEKQQFLTEFKALLEKYDVAISAVASEFHPEAMEVYKRETGETWLAVSDSQINFRDIE